MMQRSWRRAVVVPVAVEMDESVDELVVVEVHELVDELVVLPVDADVAAAWQWPKPQAEAVA